MLKQLTNSDLAILHRIWNRPFNTSKRHPNTLVGKLAEFKIRGLVQQQGNLIFVSDQAKAEFLNSSNDQRVMQLQRI